MVDVIEEQPICSFWKRILAFFIDGLVLLSVGLVLGYFFETQLIQIGGWGRLAGFMIALVYFGILNSSIGNGQSIGKKCMQIRVVDIKGNNISLTRSFFRATILEAPFFLNGILLPPSVLDTPIGTVIAFVIFGAGGGIVYFYIFNRKTRQSLHDLICKTFVSKAIISRPINLKKVSQHHYLVFSAYLVLILIIQLIVLPRFTELDPIKNMISIQKKICKIDNVETASVFLRKYFGSSGNKESIVVKVVYLGKYSDFEMLSTQIAMTVLNNYDKAATKNDISVTIAYGYDLGIASSWRKYTTSMTPAEWKSKIDKKEEVINGEFNE